jgi:hypothetical protein
LSKAEIKFSAMKMTGALMVCVCLLYGRSLAATKPHSVSFGKWVQIRIFRDDVERRFEEVRVRALIVDGRTKEFTTGVPHEITDRMFVIQRVYRLNDSLPQESGAAKWMWQQGGWIQVDRISGRVQAIALSGFEAGLSRVNWFRDYAAYCGISEDGKKAYALVWELGRRKPLLKMSLNASPPEQGEPCPGPVWERDPARVTFEPAGEAKFTFTVRSHTVDMVTDADEESGEE